NKNTTKKEFEMAWQNNCDSLSLNPTHSPESHSVAQEIMKKAINCSNCEILEYMKEIVGNDLLSIKFNIGANTPLREAIYNSQGKALATLIRLGFPINDEKNMTLSYALEFGTDDDMVVQILEAGGKIAENEYDYLNKGIPVECQKYPKEKYQKNKAT